MKIGRQDAGAVGFRGLPEKTAGLPYGETGRGMRGNRQTARFVYLVWSR